MYTTQGDALNIHLLRRQGIRGVGATCDCRRVGGVAMHVLVLVLVLVLG